MRKLPIILTALFCVVFSGCANNLTGTGPVYSRESGKHEQSRSQGEAQSIIDPAREAAKLAGFLREEQDKAPESAGIENELLRLVNESRESAGARPLETETAMSWAARIRAEEIIGDTSHYRPDGEPYYTAFDEAGYSYAGKLHGENLYYMRFEKGLYSEKDAAARVFEGLVASPGNYGNMQSSSFTAIGIGASIAEDSGYYELGCVQLFSGD